MAEATIDRKAFRSLACGLDIISANNASGRQCGCVINTFLQVSSDPVRAIVSINKENATTHAIEESGKYNISVLAQSATMELIGMFGFRSSMEVEKFSGTPHAMAANGVPYVTEHTVAMFSVDVYEKVDVGTHLVFFGDVTEARVLSDETPLTYAYYHDVIRGKTPPKAVSYNPDEAKHAGGNAAAGADAGAGAGAADASAGAADAGAGAGAAGAADAIKAAVSPSSDESAPGEPRVGWQCTLCGHIVEGYPDGLPEGFRCPICEMGREFFERVYL